VDIEEAEQYDDPEWVYENLIIKGHMSAIVAPPNAGKTTIMMKEVAPALASRGYEVVYVNADVGQADAKSMVREAKESGYRLLLPDMKSGLSMNHFVEDLAAYHGSFPNHVFMFDTLKKMTDVINKSQAKELYTLLRSMTARGATVVALGHTNKYNAADGEPIFEGTADLRSDFDELIYLSAEKNEDGTITVSTKPDKVRGKFEPITFRIELDRSVTRLDTFIDVETRLKNKAQREKDSPTIELITEAILAGDFTESKIKEHCKAHGTGWRTVQSVLARYANDLWTIEFAYQHNAKQYFLKALPHEGG